MITLTANMAAFRKQMREMLPAVKKTEAEFLNKRSIQVLIGSKGYPGAVQLTKKVTAAQIKKDLNRKYGVGTVEVNTRGKNKGQLKKRVTWLAKPTKLLWLLAAKMLRKQGVKFINLQQWNSAIAAAATRIAAARDSSRAYLAAGWLAAVRAMGHTRRSDNNRSLRPVGTKGKRIGFGSLATPNKLRFEAYNDASSNGRTDSIIRAGLNQAISSQIKDMRDYLRKQIKKTARKHSDAK